GAGSPWRKRLYQDRKDGRFSKDASGGKRICAENIGFLPLAGKKRNIRAGEGEARRSQKPVGISLHGRRHPSASLPGSHLGPVLFSVVFARFTLAPPMGEVSVDSIAIGFGTEQEDAPCPALKEKRHVPFRLSARRGATDGPC